MKNRRLVRHLGVGLFVFCGGASHAAAAGSTGDCDMGQRYFDLAQKAKQEYRADDQLEFLRRAVGSCPEFSYLLALAAATEAQLGDDALADAAEIYIQAYDAADTAAERAEATAGYANLLFLSGDPQRALKYIYAARNMDQNNARIAELAATIDARAADLRAEDVKRNVGKMAFKPLYLMEPGTTGGSRPRQPPASAGGQQPVVEPAIAESLLIKLNFIVNSVELDPRTRANVDLLADQLGSDTFAGKRFTFVGHADVRGDQETNRRLSLARASAIYDQVIMRDPSLRDRIAIEGAGETRPLSWGTGEADHAVNRRLEVTYE